MEHVSGATCEVSGATSEIGPFIVNKATGGEEGMRETRGSTELAEGL